MINDVTIEPVVEVRATRGRVLGADEKLRIERARNFEFCPKALRAARLRADLPHSVVSSTLGVNLDLVRQWETGERKPGGQSVLKMLLLYNAEPVDFMAEREN